MKWASFGRWLAIHASIFLSIFTGGCARRGWIPENPVARLDTADPGVVLHEDFWYSYSTSGWGEKGALHIRRSRDWQRWRHRGFLIPAAKKPIWIGGTDFWAPEVHRRGDRWIALYSARGHDNRFRIGASTSASPDGPWIPWPHILAQDDGVGLIDASLFRDPLTGVDHLLWKEDRNALDGKQPTPIRMVAFDDDTLTTHGTIRTLIVNEQPWEGRVVEAPQLLHHGSHYYLLYSGNAFYNANYGVGVARAKSLDGPWQKYGANPILRSDHFLEGPGHSFTLQRPDGGWWLFFHARVRGSKWDARQLMVGELEWGHDGWPRVRTVAPARQARPAGD